MNDFFETLASAPERAFYGPAHVFAAHEMCAIDKLLITDALFRDANAAARRRWVTLVEEVNGGGGTALIFSSQHESGEAARGAHRRRRDAEVSVAGPRGRGAAAGGVLGCGVRTEGTWRGGSWTSFFLLV